MVEGGASKQILSQFNGPVTFNGNVRFNKDLRITKKLIVDGESRFTNGTEATSACGGVPSGGVIIEGGISIGNKLSTSQRAISVLEGNVSLCNTTDSTGVDSGSFITDGGAGFAKNVYIGGILDVTSNINADGGLHLPDNDVLTAGATASNSHFAIWHNVTVGGTRTNIIRDNTSSSIYIQSDSNVEITNKSNTEQGLIYTAGAGIQLRHQGQLRLETNSSGIKVHDDIEAIGDITAFLASDRRLKDNITPIPNALKKVLSISGNTFDWNGASKNEGKGDTGVIAQEIEALDLPGVTTIRDDGTHAVAYEKLVPLLIEAIKELNSKVDAFHS